MSRNHQDEIQVGDFVEITYPDHTLINVFKITDIQFLQKDKNTTNDTIVILLSKNNEINSDRNNKNINVLNSASSYRGRNVIPRLEISVGLVGSTIKQDNKLFGVSHLLNNHN